MKICNICLKNDILCSACNRLLKSGQISNNYVIIARELAKTGIKDFVIIETEKMIALVLNKEYVKKVIGVNGRNVKSLETLMKKRVKIVAKENEKLMIEEIIGVPVIAINVLYSEMEIKKVRVDKRYKKIVKLDSVKTLESILKGKYEIFFE